MAGQVPKEVYLYRLVHWQNVEHILRHGLCTRKHSQADPNYIAIGDRSLIENRAEYPIPGRLYAGSLGDYVPFYFGPHSPMLYMIIKGLKGIQQRPQEDLVYLISSLSRIKAAGCEFFFTDRHAKTRLARSYQDESDLDKIDWDVVKSKEWKNTEEDTDRRDRKQAEFLVKDYVPISCIQAILVKSRGRQEYIQGVVKDLQLPIDVHREKGEKWYYWP
ncbi:protein of unknown function [Catalinimonas alkaloidigena]|uniref:DarT domain-containing protein n=1 Tax=Catalinimonas alkaloidigena TaxID=1075417 RepID=A0A1G9QJK9_9BACT|nr:DUF4433 domain-containing protein [Catalinimonas alkaloidigena]SDM11031.1 protein of unknown function [Catalinimonas alkaloidigena]